jgi:fructose-specific phosphotransferase system IIC component
VFVLGLVVGLVNGLIIGLITGFVIGLIAGFIIGLVTGFFTGVVIGLATAVGNPGRFDGYWDTHLIAIAEWMTSAIVNDADLDFDATVLPGVAEWLNKVPVDGIADVFREVEEGKW